MTASLIMAASIGAAASGPLSTAVAFAAGVLASMVLGTVPLPSLYQAVEWPVIVLLAALIPVATVIESIGAADMVARVLMESVAHGNAVAAPTIILLVTMLLTGVVSKAATAAMMCPVAIGTAATLRANADPFLMAVAIRASCAFLSR